MIRRLRIFGHGAIGCVQIGPFLYTGRRAEDVQRGQRIDQADLTQVISVTETEVRTKDGQLVRREYGLTNEPYLRKLAGKFDPKGWVELHSCQIVGKNGQELIRALAKLWRVEVYASESKQIVGGGLEGKVWKATPSGAVVPK